MEELEVSSAYFFGQSSLVLPDGLGLLSELRTQEEGVTPCRKPIRSVCGSRPAICERGTLHGALRDG